MSMVRIVTRIVPQDAPPDSVSQLLTAEQVDQPVRTTQFNNSDGVTAETTFCRVEAIPKSTDPDAAIAAKCETIPGLSCLKKSRLRLTTVAEPVDQHQPVMKVAPEFSPDGTCSGILLSIPLRIPRSEVHGEPSEGSLRFQTSTGGPAEGSRFQTKTGGTPEGSLRFQTSSGGPLEGSLRFQTSSGGTPEGSLWNQTKTGGPLEGFQTRTVDPPEGSRFKTSSGFFAGDSGASKLQEPNQNTALSNGGTNSTDNGYVPNGASTFSCKQCGKSFYNRVQLQYHSLAHKNSKKKLSCDHCGKKFFGRKRLAAHMNTEHRQSTVDCPFCDAKLNSGMELKRHMSQHSEQLPHQCGVCRERFRSKKTLLDHSRQHARETRFECRVCGTDFHKKALLEAHYSSVHAEEWGNGIA